MAGGPLSLLVALSGVGNIVATDVVDPDAGLPAELCLRALAAKLDHAAAAGAEAAPTLRMGR